MENIQTDNMTLESAAQNPDSAPTASTATASAPTVTADAPALDAPASEMLTDVATRGVTPNGIAPAEDAPPAASMTETVPTPEPSGVSADEGAVGAQPQAALMPDALTPPQPTEPVTAPASESPASEAPASEAPASEAPASEAPASEAPASEAPASEAPASEAPATPAARSNRAPSMAQLMESDEFSTYMSGADVLQRGALLRGTVVRMDDGRSEILVDVGTKSEGIIPRSELGDEAVNIGDEIEVVVLRPEDDDGHPVLSKRRADYEKTWRSILEAKNANEKLEGTVIKEVKGGLIVNLGVEAFVPASQVDARHRGDLSRFVGRTIPVRVMEIDRKKNKVIASHKLAAEEDRQKREEEIFDTLQKGEVIEGIVRRITDFGAFVDIGGVDGLLHVREMGWSRVEHPDQVVKKGQKLQLLVLEIDKERKRVALGLKQLLPDPWKKAAESFPQGATVSGKVARIAPTCAFIELEDGVEAILPISEMSEERIKAPEDVISVGQIIEARVKQNQANQRRLVLSLRAPGQERERERREPRSPGREISARSTGGGNSGGGGNNSGGGNTGGGGSNSGGGNSGGGNSGGGDDGGVRLGDVFGSALRVARDRGRERNEQRATQDLKAAKARALEAAETEEEDFSLDSVEEDVDLIDGDEGNLNDEDVD